MSTTGTDDLDALLHTVARVTAGLRSAGIRFAIAGGLATYALGGPISEHDVDVLVREQDVRRAVSALVGMGMRAAQPPESWLAKVYDGDRMVDLIHHHVELPVTDDDLDRAAPMRVGSVVVPVQSATDLLVDRLLLLGSGRFDLTGPLSLARALREQINWTVVRAETCGSPYAEAFLLLSERLGIQDRTPSEEAIMTTPQEPNLPQYTVQRLRRALAEDPRSAELGIRVMVRGEDVFLCGYVASPELRDAMTEVVRDIAPHLVVHNDIRIARHEEPSGSEELR